MSLGMFSARFDALGNVFSETTDVVVVTFAPSSPLPSSDDVSSNPSSL